MNATQIRYARERASLIFEDRKRAIKEKHTTKEVKLSVAAKAEALRKGHFVAKVPRSGGAYCLSDFVDFHDEAPAKVDQKAIDRETAALNVAFRDVVDSLILGDAEKGLRLLKDFEGGR